MRVLAIATIAGTLGAQSAAYVKAESVIENRIEHCFSAGGSSACDHAESGWRIKWRIYPPFQSTANENYYGKAGIWEITGVEFMRGIRNGRSDWVPILNNLSLTEMFVPYDSGKRIYDISNGSAWGTLRPFPLVRIRKDADGDTFLAPHAHKEIFDECVIAEVADDGLRWIENRDFNATGKPDRARRGKVLNLWATLFAGNYRYIMLYGFADDGTIHVRAGATAENFVNPEDDSDGHGVHVHMGGWRVEFSLGPSARNQIAVVEHIQDTQLARAQICEQAFRGAGTCGILSGGREGGIAWDPRKFTSVRVTSTEIQNHHQSPAKYIAYNVVPKLNSGTLRTYASGEEFTEFDFWTTRLIPDDTERRWRGLELQYRRLPTYVATPEAIDGHPVVIWHRSSLLHIPRGEDFGPVNYDKVDGVALTTWGGFDLIPRDLWDRTPFLDRKN